MTGVMVVQGRELSAEDIGLIQGLMTEHRDWGRSRLSEELCHRWDWRNARGRIKDMAARTLLLKLERAGHIRLPKRRRKSTNGFRNRNAPLVAHATAPIRGALRQLRPLALSVVDSSSEDLRLFNCLLSRYHYLGHRNTVGENIRYLVRDRAGRPVGCALFGSAAWKCAARDAWIGWDRTTREANLGLLTNNTRFLVLPWVEVPHLASYLLGQMARGLSADWEALYGHHPKQHQRKNDLLEHGFLLFFKCDPPRLGAPLDQKSQHTLVQNLTRVADTDLPSFPLRWPHITGSLVNDGGGSINLTAVDY